MIIAIDGPAGSGKSTISKLVAKDLDLIYLDTGAMYRLVTLKALKMGILDENLENLDKINELLDNLEIDIREDGFYLDGVDVSEEIRKPIVSENVSKIAAIKGVRIKMVDLQRAFSKAAMVIGIISNGLNLIGVSSYWQLIVKGIIIATAVILDSQKEKFKRNAIIRK